MDPANPPPESPFYRIFLGPYQCRTRDFAFEHNAWIVEASEAQASADKKTMVFRRLSLTDRKENARIYPASSAAAIISVLAATYPAAELVPASFEEWVAYDDPTAKTLFW